MEELKRVKKQVYCPQCGGKTTTKVYADTVLVEFPVFCKKCKRETRINLIKLKMVKSAAPDA